MADPASVASSIVSLITVGVKISIQLSQFIESVRAAPGEIHDLAKELTDLCSILKKLQTAFGNASSQVSIQHQELSADFQNVLDSCMDKFIQLQMLVKAHEIKNGDGALAKKWKGWRWTFQEEELMTLRTQLEAHKATLNITLALATYTDFASFKNSQSRLEDATREIIDRLMDSGDGESTAATYQASISFGIQRFLSSTSSVSSSRPSSPVFERSLDAVFEEEAEKPKAVRKDSSLGSHPKADPRPPRRKHRHSKHSKRNTDTPPNKITIMPPNIDLYKTSSYGVPRNVPDLNYSADTPGAIIHTQDEIVDWLKSPRANPTLHASETQPPAPPARAWSLPYPEDVQVQPPQRTGKGRRSIAAAASPTLGQTQSREMVQKKQAPKNLRPIKPPPFARNVSVSMPSPPIQKQFEQLLVFDQLPLELQRPKSPPVIVDTTGYYEEILLSSVLHQHDARKTQPSAALQKIRHTINSVSQDLSFSQTVNQLYKESAARRWARWEQENVARKELYLSCTDSSQPGDGIGREQLEVHNIGLSEREIYNTYVYRKIEDRLQQSIQLLSDRYSDIMEEIPRALAGEDRWLVSGGIELTELLEVWLALWNQVETRYDMVEEAFWERDKIFKEWEAASGVIGSSENGLVRIAKEHASLWASRKRERTSGLTAMIDKIIAQGLSKEREYVDKVWAAAHPYIASIHVLLGRSLTDKRVGRMRSQILSYRELLKEAQLPYILIINALREVELHGNVWKRKSMLADLKSTSSNVSKVKKLKGTKDDEVREKYEQEINTFKNKFELLDASIKMALENCNKRINCVAKWTREERKIDILE